jgi:hypothetical protein
MTVKDEHKLPMKPKLPSRRVAATMPVKKEKNESK